MYLKITRSLVCVILISAGVPACQPMQSPGSYSLEAQGGHLIGTDDIERSATSNIWDLLRQQAHGFDFREDRNGLPRSITTHHGPTSILLSNADGPVIIVDGARIDDIRYLQQISTNDVDGIELLSGIRGTATQGTNAGAGVIYIHTKSASQPE